MDQIIRCPRPECNHPINDHNTHGGCQSDYPSCNCHVTANTIAVAAVQTALFGELTQPDRLQRISRQPDGSWS